MKRHASHQLRQFQDPKSDSYDATALQRDQLKAVVRPLSNYIYIQ